MHAVLLTTVSEPDNYDTALRALRPTCAPGGGCEHHYDEGGVLPFDPSHAEHYGIVGNLALLGTLSHVPAVDPFTLVLLLA